MQLLSRREYNLILRSLDKYELYMNQREKDLSEFDTPLAEQYGV